MPWSLQMVLYASILLVLFLTYFAFRFFKCVNRLELQPPWLWRFPVLLLILVFVAYPALGLIEFWTYNSFSRTSYPFALIYLFWYGLVFSGVMLNWLLLHDILLPVVIKLSGTHSRKIKKRFARFFLIISALTLLYTGGKMIWDTHRITVEEISVNVAKGQDETPAESLTIVHIADLHADIFTDEEKMDRYVRLINEADPDLVIFAGDLITSGIGHVQKGANALAKIQSTYGVFAVLGDHDFWAGADPIVDALRERGITVLLNEHSQITHGSAVISITGVTEIYSSRLEREVLKDLIFEVPDEGIKIVTSHQATNRLIEFSENSGTDMLLAGHTHGGQVRIPVFFYPFTAVRSETAYVNGNWRIGEMLLNINSGLGFTLSPVRYNAPAQVSVITVYE